MSEATLSLYTFAAWGEGADGDFSVHIITSYWNPDRANWIGSVAGVKWETEGGDFISSPVATFSINGQSGQWVTFSVTSAVQEFITNPLSNYGLLIKNTAGVRGPLFNASESADISRRPKLNVTYETSTVSAKTPKVHMNSTPGINRCHNLYNLLGRTTGSLPRRTGGIYVIEPGNEKSVILMPMLTPETDSP